VIIPARYHSSRLPGKALADIAGQPMIEHVYRRASEARGVDAVIVATDDERIAACVERVGGVARMTRADHRTGTDRVAEVASTLQAPLIVNLQGDEPLVRPELIEQVLAPLASGDVQMSTLRCAIDDPRDYTNPHVVKVVVDRAGDALYFSRAAIPYLRSKTGADAGGQGAAPGLERRAFKHIGLYGYRRECLLWFAALPQTALETAESLEQLRALEHGVRIRTSETAYDAIGVDTPADLDHVRQQFQELTAGTRERRHEHTS
jgi:3-deoxy-manno-octulosonate cytidylyltransferase (CMP-KDO synthetase)